MNTKVTPILNKDVEELILLHMDYVEALAKKISRTNPRVDVNDLIQSGNVGLIEAAKRFDKKKAKTSGASFKTYAHNWIMKYFLEEIKKSNFLIHIPDKKMREVSKINSINNDLFQLLGREPTYDEIVNEYWKRYGGKCTRKNLIN